MAITMLSDVIVPEVFSPYIQEQANVTSRLIASGAVAPSAILNDFLAGGGSSVNVPSWTNPAGVTFNSSNDNPASIVVPAGISAVNQIAMRMNQNWHVGSSTFTSALAGSNPLASVASQVAQIYNANRQNHLVAQLNGLFATGGALDSEVADGNVWSSDLLIQAESLFEDFTTGSGLLIVNSTTFAAMRAENLVTVIPLVDQGITVPTYLGYTVVVDNKIGAVAAYVCRPGSILIGSGTVGVTPYADEKGGNGGGIEYLALRDEYALHVGGTSFVGAGVVNPTAAQLSAPANWAAVSNLAHIGVKAITVTP